MTPSDGAHTPSLDGPADPFRLMVLTLPEPACGRALRSVVAECLEAGATSIQLRDKEASANRLAETASDLLTVTRPAGAPLIVNDRLDVALAVGADGVHLGPDDLPIEAARRLAPTGFLIGYSTDQPAVGAEAADAGADYLGVGAVFGTSSKPGLENEAIGPDRVGEVLRASGLPCVGIGGITAANADPVFQTGAGVAVLSYVMAAEDPPGAVEALSRLERAARPEG